MIQTILLLPVYIHFSSCQILLHLIQHKSNFFENVIKIMTSFGKELSLKLYIYETFETGRILVHSCITSDLQWVRLSFSVGWLLPSFSCVYTICTSLTNSRCFLRISLAEMWCSVWAYLVAKWTCLLGGKCWLADVSAEDDQAFAITMNHKIGDCYDNMKRTDYFAQLSKYSDKVSVS